MENQSAQVWCNSWLINYLDSFRFEWKYFLPLQGKYCKKGSYGALQPHTQYLDQKLSHSNLSCLLYVASNVCTYTFGITNGVTSLLIEQFYEPAFLRDFFMKHSCCNFANNSWKKRCIIARILIWKRIQPIVVRYMCMRYLYASWHAAWWQ